MATTEYRRLGLTVREHTIDVPWDPAKPAETFSLYARELVPSGGEDLPLVVYLQGGPGFPAPRPVERGGVIGKLLERYRVVLLDQRGTGRSHRIDAASAPEDLTLERLSTLRQDFIVQDAEALREYLGVKTWNLFGQSFGGFCITSYLSLFPHSVDRAYLTGGLPTLSKNADDLYRSTYGKLAVRHARFYAQFPWAEARVREIARHLDTHEEILPTGERLSARRFRTIGIELGRGTGFDTLAYLLEEPFRSVNGEKVLRTDFLADVGARVSFAGGPLYAAIHESIYGAVAGPGATAWAAERVRGEFNQFGDCPTDDFFLTGEHIYPWQFDEDPALTPLKGVAEELAQFEWTTSPYNPDALAESPAITAAAIYVDDIFVPFEESLETAAAYRDLRPMITNRFQHNGIAHDGAGIVTELFRLTDEY